MNRFILTVLIISLLFSTICIVEDYYKDFQIWETDGLYIFQTHNNKMGFFNSQNHFFFPPQDIMIYTFNAVQGQLLTVENSEGMYGFMDCYNGKMVIPFQFNGDCDEIGCINNYILAANWVNIDGGVYADFHLYNIIGEEIIFPPNIMPISHVENGYIIITERFSNAWKYYGLATSDGKIIIYPEYKSIDELLINQ